MIHVIAIITAKPGMREQILTHFRANIPAVLAEDGCIEYGPAIDAEGIGRIQTQFGPDSFVVSKNGRAQRRSRPMPRRRTWRPMRRRPRR